jgi:hypothetical protein
MERETGSASSNLTKETQAMKALIRIGMVLAAAMMVAGFLAMSFAQCPNGAVGNSSIGMQMRVPGLPDDGSGTGTIITKFWIQGDAAAHNSGTLPTTSQISSLGGNNYSVWTDWGQEGVTGRCPDPTGKTLFLYSIENGGAGQYILMLTSYASYFSGWDYDAITNGGGKIASRIQGPDSIPELRVRGMKVDKATILVGLEWDPIRDLAGFYDLAPFVPINTLTGIVVRFDQRSDAPTSHRSADWKLGAVVDIGSLGTDPGFVQIEVPNLEGVTTYFALSLVFDRGTPLGGPAFTETDFVGPQISLATYPAGGPSFASVSAVRAGASVTVSWAMASERNTVSYQVLAASTSHGPFRPMGAPVAQTPAAGGSYSALVGCRADAQYFKVGAKDTNSLVTFSAVVRSTGP